MAFIPFMRCERLTDNARRGCADAEPLRGVRQGELTGTVERGCDHLDALVIAQGRHPALRPGITRFRCGSRRARVLLVALALLMLPTALEAEPIKVRLREGNSRGFVVLRSLEGEPLAYGESRQKPVGEAIESVLALKFKDGSRRDETVTFSQNGAFRVVAYRLVQRGPSFPTTEVSFDRRTGRYTARTQEKKEDQERTASGTLQMPADLYNGMAVTLLKNLPAGTAVSTHVVVFTPKPRLIRMTLSQQGEAAARVGAEAKRLVEYLAKLEVTGVAGVVATVIGKDPPDSRYWFVAGDVPAFARFEGAMYLHGPVWRLEQTVLEWTK
jgi:hypothetical protein